MSLRDIISDQRLGPYLQEAGFDEDRALRIYAWNMRLCGAFYPVLSAVEIALRNRVEPRLRAAYGPEWWSSVRLLAHLDKKGRGPVKRAEATIVRRGREPDSGRMTAELTFGFWSGMLLPKYEADLWTPLAQGFPDLPAGLDLAALRARCEQMREARNRLFHHEPLFRQDTSLLHARCLEFIGWMSPVKAAWIRAESQVPHVLRQKP